jgi:hypothetical protein
MTSMTTPIIATAQLRTGGFNYDLSVRTRAFHALYPARYD